LPRRELFELELDGLASWQRGERGLVRVRGREFGCRKVETASVPTARSECFECGRRAQIQRATGSFGLGTNGSLKKAGGRSNAGHLFPGGKPPARAVLLFARIFSRTSIIECRSMIGRGDKARDHQTFKRASNGYPLPRGEGRVRGQGSQNLCIRLGETSNLQLRTFNVQQLHL
jgi:hypothetical protein